MRAIAFEPNEQYDPYEFIPERFLDHDKPQLDPASWAFGFGRRYADVFFLSLQSTIFNIISGFRSVFSICPGKALAENSVFVIIACILSSLDILPPSSGNLKPEFGLDLVRCEFIIPSKRDGVLF